jgi:inorganic triphosphatase YgiF
MATDRVPSEVELKLEASSPEVLRHIAQLRMLDRFRLRPRRAVRLHSVYFDTRDLALARAGVALRVRRNGRAWEATAKWSGRVARSVHERPELTVALPGPPAAPFTLPDGPLRTELTAVVLGRRLAPILITDIRRLLRDLLPGEGTAAESLAEVALDTVELRGADGHAALPLYFEIEVERRAGRRRDLDDVGRALRQRFGLIPSRASKFARGLAELRGHVFDAPVVASIAAGDTVARAARTVAAAQLARVRMADPGTRLGHDTEAVHQQRVAIRRVRAALRTFAAGVPERLQATLRAELRWIGQELGAVRDIDVQLASLDWHARHLGPAAHHLQSFVHHLQQQRAGRRAALATTLDSRRYFRLLTALERFAASPPPRRVSAEAAQSVAAVGHRALKRAMRKLLERGNAVGELPAADKLHALRIRAKRVRYLLEALRPISGGPGRKLTRQMARLQDVLGRFNDAIVAAAAIRAFRDGPEATGDAAVRQALTALVDAELRRAGVAQSEFARAWRRFSGKATLHLHRGALKRLKSA